jgi:glycine betaine/proline transport system substrate-binding protein
MRHEATPSPIAEMTWLSAGTLAYVTKAILAEGYGCNVQIVPGDTVPTASSMLAKGEPDIAPELWVSTVKSTWDQMLAKGTVYKAGDIFASGGQEGWWIPDYIAEAHPEIRSVSDLKNNWQVFEDASSPGKGRFYACPPGWGCEIITNNLVKALDLEATYEVYPTGSGANLKAMIARQVSRKKPFIGWYWGPTEVIGKYKLKVLEMPAYDQAKFTCLTDAKCEKPELTAGRSVKLRSRPPRASRTRRLPLPSSCRRCRCRMPRSATCWPGATTTRPRPRRSQRISSRTTRRSGPSGFRPMSPRRSRPAL